MADNVVRSIGAMSIAFSLIVARGELRAQSLAAAGQPETVTKITMVTVHVDAVPLIQALKIIAQQAGLAPFYTDVVTNNPAMVTVHVTGVTPDVAFERALRGTGLMAKVVEGKVLFKRTTESMTPMVQGGIVATITDATTKRPLRGAMVTLDKSTKGMTAGEDGRVQFPAVSPGLHTVRVRLLGYVKASKAVTVVEGQAVALEVALTPSVNALDQVVVTGTIVATAQKAIPNAMTVITAKEIEQRGITQVQQLFRGDVPGLFASNLGSSSPLDSVAVYSRGASSLSTLNYTAGFKTYVDGIELANPSYMSQIDPRSIERIEILTGPQASTIYGSNAINGVMQIFTKRGAGASSHPQVYVNLRSGLIQNNFSTALAPQHDDAVQITGTDRRWSYNAGGTWRYIGRWTPSKQTTTMGGFGAVRVQMNTLTADVSLRRALTRNTVTGSDQQPAANAFSKGLRDLSWRSGSGTGIASPRTMDLTSQTIGVTLGYTPTEWWSHEFVLGTDLSDADDRIVGRGFTSPSDSLLQWWQRHNARNSLRYATTVNIPLTSHAGLVVTGGADGWTNLVSSAQVMTPTLTGTLTGTPRISRQPGRNTGAFAQAQLSLGDMIFLTSGLRSEWNPDYGADANPNLAPRVGMSMVRIFGDVTAKLRASYGRSTRPPLPNQKNSVKLSTVTSTLGNVTQFGDIDTYLANPDLGPEYQRGGEGGLELYLGQRGSFVITRYKQTVNGLIAVAFKADSARSLQQYPAGCTARSDGYCWYNQYQYINLGIIGNQGWEYQGTINFGAFTTKGVYSQTKSRINGIDERYRSKLNGSQYQPGAEMYGPAEHTWVLSTTYASGATTATLSANGTGKVRKLYDAVMWASMRGRLDVDKATKQYSHGYRPIAKGYTMMDFNTAQRIRSNVDAIVQVTNLTNFYQTDNYDDDYAVIGRQTWIGFRVRW